LVETNISPRVQIAHGKDNNDSELLQALRELKVELLEVESPTDLQGREPALLVLDPVLLQASDSKSWRLGLLESSPDALIVANTGLCEELDLSLSGDSSVTDKMRILHLALRRWILQRENSQLQTALRSTERNLELLADIGIALSAEKDLDHLLAHILQEAQNLACCDAASLFLVEKEEDGPGKLAFKLTRNDSLETDFHEQRLELDRASIVGYAAVTGHEVNIPDAYALADEEPYSFNPAFDISMGYRTVSILAVPMRNYREEVVGVLQFINRKTSRELKLVSPELALSETQPFHAEQIRLLRALAGQSAIALENNLLLDNINRLFGGFVQAAVAAIEQRDPTTSGHSFRVADLTTGLAQALPQANIAKYRDVIFREEEIRELRYAALLHDFGKVGVREHVLVKAKKLPDKQYDIIRYRIRLAQERLRRQAGEQMLSIWRASADKVELAAIEQRVNEEMARLETFLAAVEHANEPTLLDDGDFEHLKDIHAYPFEDDRGQAATLIDAAEFGSLSIRRGSLTLQERKEIESHVVHTANFLRLIPWTPELARIPAIAESHHEKLDGTGYPNGLLDTDIPVGSKMMAICDIYDALTASDRPYKSAVPKDVAYRILEDEGSAGKLDTDLVGLFISADIQQILVGKEYGSVEPPPEVGCSNHPCDHLD
jgi:HD-GYP domain-containing protein (c-di-GMP phosphodiesterase class II)